MKTVAGTKDEAYALAAAVDAAMGYPRDDAPVGGGEHAPSSTTLSYAEPMQHPETGEWHYPVDATNFAAVAENTTAPIDDVTWPAALDSTLQPDAYAARQQLRAQNDAAATSSTTTTTTTTKG